MLRKFAVLAPLSLALAGWAPAAKPDANAPVTIMTQNMDDGTDQTYIIGALTGQIPVSGVRRGPHLRRAPGEQLRGARQR